VADLLRVEIETCESGWLATCWRAVDVPDGEPKVELRYIRAGNPTMDEAWDRAREWLRGEIEKGEKG